MHGVVSGRSGRALILDGTSLSSFDVDNPAHLVSRCSADLPYLFGEANDLQFVEDTTIEALAHTLRVECGFTWALDLVLVLLDAENPEDLRKEAIDGLKELLTNDFVKERLENVLYSKPIPEDGDLIGAWEICLDGGQSLVRSFLSELIKNQRAISQANDAWTAIPAAMFENQHQREDFRRIAVRNGSFRELTKFGSANWLTGGFRLQDRHKNLHKTFEVFRAWNVEFRRVVKEWKHANNQSVDETSKP